MATDIEADGAGMAIGRRGFLKGAVAVALGGAAAGAAIAGEDLRIERRELLVPTLHPSHDGLRIVQLSDTHVGPLTPGALIREAVAEANRLAPDLAVLTGDYLSNDPAGVALVAEQLAGLRAPTVGVLGNHDHWANRLGAVQALERLGYCVLQNENTTLPLRGEPFTVVGIDDNVTGHADPVRAMKGARAGSRVFLAHDPSTADALRGAGQPMLVLSGHTHGGQVNIPGLFTARLPYKAGLYELDPVQLYVNRGLGNTWLPVRVNAPPEVTLLTLRSGAARHAVSRFPDSGWARGRAVTGP
jgi:uncharacterized protein